MTIVPDTKDWTWILDRRCPECGFDARAVDRQAVGHEVRRLIDAWRTVLVAPAASSRPREDRWSPVEYGCHVRDLFDIYDERLRLMLDEDDPTYPNWDQDATAVERHYREQQPVVVAGELAVSGERIAQRFNRVTDQQWERTGTRGDGAKFTVDSFARYFLHDPIHHLHDVGREFSLASP